MGAAEVIDFAAALRRQREWDERLSEVVRERVREILADAGSEPEPEPAA